MLGELNNSTLLDTSRFTSKSARHCVRCGAKFTAIGLVAYCEACEVGGIHPAKDTEYTVRFDESWPKRALAALDNAHGPAIDKARSLLPHIVHGTLVLTGDRGRGKTVMAAWLEYCRQKSGNQAGIYTRAMDLFESIQGTWRTNATENEDAVKRRYRTAPFLVIDEAQERGEGDWELRTLVNIIDHRYGSMLPTIIIGNLSDIQLDKYIGPSIIRRAREDGGLVECNWKSYV